MPTASSAAAPRLAALLPLLVVLAASGCLAPSAAPPPDAHGEVVLIRGLFNVFSLGMDEIADELNDDGYHALSIAGSQRKATGRKLIREAEEGTLARPLVIVGHSYGGDAAVRLTHQLDRAGVRVDKLILVDPTTPGRIPANVDKVFDVYRSSPATDWVPVLRGVAVETESPETEVVNFDLRQSDDPELSSATINHFNIDEARAVQDLVIEQVHVIAGRAPEAAFTVHSDGPGDLPAHDEASPPAGRDLTAEAEQDDDV